MIDSSYPVPVLKYTSFIRNKAFMHFNCSWWSFSTLRKQSIVSVALSNSSPSNNDWRHLARQNINIHEIYEFLLNSQSASFPDFPDKFTWLEQAFRYRFTVSTFYRPYVLSPVETAHRHLVRRLPTIFIGQQSRLKNDWPIFRDSSLWTSWCSI